MCRFPSKDDEGYKQVSGEIQILVRGVQQKMEQEQDALEKEREIANLKSVSPSQTTTASASYCM
jgi:ankyrin repeat domain-containing protein 50